MSTQDVRVLRTACDETRDALGDLCDPLKQRFLMPTMGVTEYISPSLLEQLRDAVATGRERGGRGASIPLPISTDAHDLLVKIGRQTMWLLGETGARPAGAGIEENLRSVVNTVTSTAMDLEAVLGVRNFLRSWATSIRNLLDPPKRISLWGYHCPEPKCEAEEVWRLDESDGETKRTAPLEVAFTETNGDPAIRDVHCLACGKEWPPNQLLWLGKLLGCEIAGVQPEDEGTAA